METQKASEDSLEDDDEDLFKPRQMKIIMNRN